MNTSERTSHLKEESRAERLAALNLMEDTLAARREAERANASLRVSEAKLAIELADAQQLQRISSSLVEEGNIDALYVQILEAARALMRADCASLQKLVPERNELLLLASHGLAPESAKHWEWVSMADTTSCGVAMTSPERMVVRDAEEWEYIAGSEDLAQYRLSGIRGMQSTRLVSRGGHLVGMISTHWREPHVPTEREFRLFDVLARQVADLIERRVAEDALRASEARLQTLADAVPQIIWTNSADGTADYFNRRWYEYSGLSLEESAGPGWEAIVHPDDAAASHERWERAQAAGEIFDTEYRLRGADGGYRWFIGRNVPERNAAGRVSSWFGTATDIHDRKEAEAALRVSEERLQRVIETEAVGVLFFQHDGRLVGANSVFLGMTGYTRGDFEPGEITWRTMTPPEWIAASEEQMANLVATGRIGPYEKEYLRKDGTRRWMLFAGRDLGDGTIVEFCIDVTDRRHAEDALRVSEERMRAMAENLPGGAVFVVDRDLRYLVAGGEALGVAGMKPEDFVGRTVEEVVGPEQAAEYLPQYRRALAGEPFNREHESQGRHYFSRGVPLCDTQGRVTAVLAISYDISDRKRAEEALRASEERLRGALSISTVGVVFWRDGRLTEVNEAYLSMNGFAEEEVLGQTWEEFTPEEFHEVSRRGLDELANRGESTPFEKQFCCKDGTRRWGLFTGRMVGAEVVEFVIDVTDRRHAEQAVQKSEHRMRVLADAVPQIIWTNSSEGVANYFNRRWHEYSGLTFEQSVGLGWEAIVHPEDAPRSVPAWRSALAAGVVFDTEYRLRGADGEYRWFIGRNVPMRNIEEKVTGWFGTATDVQEWKLAEQAWRISEERFRIALEAAEMAAWDYDVRAGTVIWNEHHFHILGLEPRDETVTPEYFMQFVHPEDLSMVSQRLAEAARTSGTYRAEFRMIRADNQAVRWMSGFGKAISSEGGHATRMSGVMLDTTERHEAEEALAATQERLRLIVDSAHEHAIISMDMERRVESWNPGAEAIFGYQREQMLGRSADVIFTSEDQAAGLPVQEANTALAQGRAGDCRWHQREDGSRFWANGVMLPMRKQLGGPVFGLVKILRDETPQREAEQEKERHREEIWAALQETERARADAEAARTLAEAAGEAKDHFLAVLSHELRTPLTPVAMATQTLARRKDLPEPVREALTMIRRNILLESRLVDDLLDVTKIERGKMELMLGPVSLHEVIHNAVETTRSDLEEKGQQLTLELSASAAVLVGDAGRLQQVVWNLLRNASKFTPEKGGIWVRSWNEQDRLLVAVTDTGIGIDAEALPKIFGAFTQASVSITRQFGGLGLGLAIAQAIVLAHHGELRVASAGLGHGATFTVSLPLAMAEGDGRPGGHPEEEEIRGVASWPPQVEAAIKA